MTKSKSILAVLVLSLGLTACANNDMGTKQTIGTLGGGALGAILGSNVGKGAGNITAIAAGTILGAYLGSEIGSSLDKADAQYANRAAQDAFENYPSGQSSSWRNPDSGNSGAVKPTTTYQASNGQYCREYEQTITVNGRSELAYGTACRQSDGTWRIAN